MTTVPARFAGLAWPVQTLAMFGLGWGTSLGQPPLFHWYATLIGFAAVFACLPAAKSSRQAAWWLWIFGLGYFLFALRWLIEPFQVEAEIFGWMAPFALFGMAAGLALFWALAGWVGHRFGGGFLYVALLGLAEFARAYVLTGFPWAGVAQIWVGNPVGHSLAWIGPQGLGFATTLLAALCVTPQIRPLARITAILGLTMCLILPALYPTAPDHSDADRPIVRVVQPNAPQDEKWDRSKSHIFFDRLIDHTQAGEPPDLIVWPETAIPELAHNATEHFAIAAEAARGAPLVLGMLRADERAYYNSLLTLDDLGTVQTSYDKHHLVPFGEYMPMAWLFARLGIQGLAQQAASGFAKGPGPQIIDVAGLRALPLICYEAVFPQHARSQTERPDLLLQITNDAWFGTYAGPQQHLAQARMRAIEQGLPLVRSANTGISAIIDARGIIVAELEMGVDGFVQAPLPMAHAITVYGRTGDGPWVVILALMALLTARLNLIRR